MLGSGSRFCAEKHGSNENNHIIVIIGVTLGEALSPALCWDLLLNKALILSSLLPASLHWKFLCKERMDSGFNRI